MVSVTSASRYLLVTSAPRYHPRYQSRSSMYIRGLILRTFAELVVAVPIGDYHEVFARVDVCFYRSCLKSFEMAATPDIGMELF